MLDKALENKIAQNLLVWFGLFLVLALIIQAEHRFAVAAYTMLFLMPPVYVNNLLILPLLARKKFWFLLSFIANICVFGGGSVLIIVLLNDEAIEWQKFANFGGGLLLALTFASVLKLLRDSYVLKREEKEAELKLLKAQLNPHFLFNTMNNLYGLSVLKSDKLPPLMLQLSNLLRYSLYDTKETFVPLDKEIEYLENYIALERIRLEEVDIQFEKSTDSATGKVAPMLLIVFVENAFKHLSLTKGSRVHVALQVSEKAIYFKCVNTIDGEAKSQSNLESGQSGIGLNNVKKRLALIYPDKHQLSLEKGETDYTAELTLEF